MQRIKCAVCVLLLLAVVSPLWAQDGTRFGIGINLLDFFKQNDLADEVEEQFCDRFNYPVLHFSILMQKVRIDPELSFWRYANENKSGYYHGNYSTTILHLGVGVAPYIKKTDKVVTYAGVRLCLDRRSTKTKTTSEYSTGSNGETESRRMDFIVGPYLGTEYFMTPDLSLGCEAHLMYTNIGNDEIEQNGQSHADTDDDDASFFRTQARIYLRWYF